MAGQRHLPIIPGKRANIDNPTFSRGIISPCVGCQNQTPVSLDPNVNIRSREKNWPCPKAMLYAQKARGETLRAKNANFEHPVYDETLRGTNPVYAGTDNHENPYSYIFMATYEDNVDCGWNPGFRTDRIRCKGPYLLLWNERLLNILGRPDQSDHIIAYNNNFYIDGAQFYGLVHEGATWQNHTSAKREIDTNLVVTLPGNT